METVLQVKGLSKQYKKGIYASHNVTFDVGKGEIFALIGPNGAGKTTTIRMISTLLQATEGDAIVAGHSILTEPDMVRKSITYLPDEAGAYKTMTGREYLEFMASIYADNGEQAYEFVKRGCEICELGDRLNDKISNYSRGMARKLLLARAIMPLPALAILDEPTSSLGKEEINQLMETVRGLKAKGVAILFVSHKLEELFELCNRVTVMRDGEHIVTQDIGDMTEDSLINAMVGRTLDNLYPKEFGVKGDVWLEARNLNEAGVLHDVSFKAYGGQITGFAGLVGAGRTETMRAIFGADRLDSGEIYVKGEKVHIRTPKDAIKKKIAFLTEDRKGQGLVLSLDVRTNLILANMKGFSNGPFLNKGKIEKSGQDNVESLRIKTPSLDEVTAQLSGGNQQKVVIGKWVNTDADIFIFDEPTRGIDVGAKIEVYHVMNDLVKAGKCVIMVSSELPEILAMSDHVVVMRGGRVMANIDRDTPHFNSEDIMKAAWGGELD